MGIEILKVNKSPWTYLLVYILIIIFFSFLQVLFFEGEHAAVGIGNDNVGQEEGEKAQYDRADKIREEQPFKTHPAAEDGDDLRIRGHAGSKEDDGNKGEQVTEKVNEVGDKVEIVIKNNGTQRGIKFQEIINFFRDIENDHDKD